MESGCKRFEVASKLLSSSPETTTKFFIALSASVKRTPALAALVSKTAILLRNSSVAGTVAAAAVRIPVAAVEIP